MSMDIKYKIWREYLNTKRSRNCVRTYRIRAWVSSQPVSMQNNVELSTLEGPKGQGICWSFIQEMRHEFFEWIM